jgi:anthranilate phosphoribosyltransferase
VAKTDPPVTAAMRVLCAHRVDVLRHGDREVSTKALARLVE